MEAKNKLLLLVLIVSVLFLGVKNIYATSIYWTNSPNGVNGNNNIQVFSDTTGMVETVATGPFVPRDIIITTDGSQLYFSDGLGNIIRSNTDGTNMIHIISGLIFPWSLALDENNGHLYWTDRTTINNVGSINRANLDGTNIIQLITINAFPPLGLELDLDNGYMYWGNSGDDKIQRANLDGSNITDIISGFESRDIALNKETGLMYATTADSIIQIEMDGSSQIIIDNLGNPFGLSIDVLNEKIYWTDSDTGKIQRADYDGSNVTDIVEGIDFPRGIYVSQSVHILPQIHCVRTAIELQDALNVASNNSTEDIIKIQQGTYYGNFVYESTESYGLTIEGGYSDALCAVRDVDPAITMLDAQNSGTVLVMSAPDVAVNFIVSGLTLQNGNYLGEYNSGGLYVNANNGNLNLLNSSILNNRTTGLYSGGGIYNLTVDITISDSIISNNSKRGGYISADTVTVSNSIISDNSFLTLDTIDGGGLWINGNNINLTGNTIANNTAYRGGGLYIENGANIILNNNIISHNASEYSGAGVLIYGNSITVRSNIVEYNNSLHSSDSNGGGIRFIGNIAFLEDNIISYNDSGTGGGVDLRISNSANLINNVINGNTASWLGGGIFFGALHLSSPNCTLANNTIVSNNSPEGGGVFLLFEEDEGNADIYNNVIMNNGFDVGKDIYIRNDFNGNGIPSPVNLFNNDFDQSTTGTYIQDPSGVDSGNNLNNLDPQFDLDGYHLTNNSPCIDAGRSVNAPDTDIDGDSRPQGANYDIGADEHISDISIDSILEFFDESVADGTLVGSGKKPWVAKFKLWLFRHTLETAKFLIEKDKMKYACKALNRAFLRCDGEPRPKDFVKGDAIAELPDRILELRAELGCE